MGLQDFPFRNTHTENFPLVKKKEKKNIRQRAIQSVANPQCSSLENWAAVQKSSWTLGLLPLLPLHLLKYVCFLFLVHQSKPSTGVSRENLTCTSSFCDSHLPPQTASEELCGRAALSDTLALCRNCIPVMAGVALGLGRWQVEGGVTLCASLKGCWYRLLELSPQLSVSISPREELKAEPTNSVTWYCQWLLQTSKRQHF